jgi:hypothetical protein
MNLRPVLSVWPSSSFDSNISSRGRRGGRCRNGMLARTIQPIPAGGLCEPAASGVRWLRCWAWSTC